MFSCLSVAMIFLPSDSCLQWTIFLGYHRCLKDVKMILLIDFPSYLPDKSIGCEDEAPLK